MNHAKNWGSLINYSFGSVIFVEHRCSNKPTFKQLIVVLATKVGGTFGKDDMVKREAFSGFQGINTWELFFPLHKLGVGN